MEVRDAETGELLVLRMPEPLPPPRSPTRQRTTHDNGVHAETQSKRKLGDNVAWQHKQLDRIEKAEERFRKSIEGVRHELRRRDISDIVKRQLEAELLDRMKAQYAEQVQRMVVEEMAREREREVQVRLETSALARQRLSKRHASERAFYKQQVERVRDECELSLTAAMAQHNFLR
ncbi:hypothetical protein Gpo141_00003911 [Globisporangium polare]